jgi:hypothetical protein
MCPRERGTQFRRHGYILTFSDVIKSTLIRTTSFRVMWECPCLDMFSGDPQVTW